MAFDFRDCRIFPFFFVFAKNNEPFLHVALPSYVLLWLYLVKMPCATAQFLLLERSPVCLAFTYAFTVHFNGLRDGPEFVF